MQRFETTKEERIPLSRKRILDALARREPDRIPRDLGATESTGLTGGAHHRLCGLLGLQQVPRIFEPFQYVAYTPSALRKRFGIDALNLTPSPKRWVRRKNPLGFEVDLPEAWAEEETPDGETVVHGPTGEVRARRSAGGHYFFTENPPLRAVESTADLRGHEDEMEAFDDPFFADETKVELRQRTEALHASGGAVVFNLCCHFLAAGQILRGYEAFMIDLMTNEALAEAILEHLLAAYLRRIERLAPELAHAVDIVLLNDDLGTQNGPMLSPELYRRFIKPRQAVLFERAKQAFDAPVLVHSCGAVREFIPDLIEVGVDALNPVQISAAGMEPESLKRDFGNDLCFWGGGADTQNVLNRSTPGEVKEHVKRLAGVFVPGGGFVFSQVHNVQPDVPPENVLAMFEALDEL